MATGFGLIPVRKEGGGQFLARPYSVPAADGTALFVGDVVKLDGVYDAVNQLPSVIRAATGDKLLGVIVGFVVDPLAPYSKNRVASTLRVALVIDDPDVIYQVQEDAVGGAAAASDIADLKNYNIIVAAGSTATGASGTMLQSSSVTQSAADLKVLAVARSPSNLAAQTAGAILEVKILSPAINLTQSGV